MNEEGFRRREAGKKEEGKKRDGLNNKGKTNGRKTGAGLRSKKRRKAGQRRI